MKRDLIWQMIKVRNGKKKDISKLFELVKELAHYEKATDEVSNTIERMEQDGFGNRRIYGFLIAEANKEIIGASIYYFRYSTWKGKTMYLEDLIVTEKKRGRGAGKLLFEATIEKGKISNCTGMMWQVLDWNQPAIDFYKKYSTRFDSGWINCNIDF